MSGALLPCNIGEIKVGDVWWKCKVIVVAKSNIERLQRGERCVQRCLMQDAEGTTVEALMWDDNVARFRDTLKPFCTYMIHGAHVKEIEDLQWAGDKILEWLMIGRTVVELVTDDNEVLSALPVWFADLATAYVFSPYSDLFDVVVAVVRIEEPRQIKVGGTLTWIQDLLVADESCVLTPITLWDGFMDNQTIHIARLEQTVPIVVCYALNVSRYTGFPSTNVATYITVEPDVPEVRSLRHWVSVNAELINALKQATKPKRQVLLTTGNPGAIVPVGGVSTGQPKFYITGKLRIPDAYQSVAYCECKGCRKNVVAELRMNIHYRNCNEIHEAVPCCRIIVCIRTLDGSVQATMFTSAAQQLLRKTPESIHASSKQDVRKLLVSLNREYQQTIITGIIGDSLEEYSGETPMFVLDEWNIQGRSESIRDESTEKVLQQQDAVTDQSGNRADNTKQDLGKTKMDRPWEPQQELGISQATRLNCHESNKMPTESSKRLKNEHGSKQ